jgi:O-antigen/teichoic acid export membrane protein
MSVERNSYRSTVKATSIFGGVQILLILISIVRAKFTAKYLGPEGLGIFSLYTTSYGFIISLTNFSLGVSAVKDVSEAFVNNNQTEINRTLIIVKKLMMLTGFLGMIITVLFSPLLSLSAFGNYSHIIDFIFLSIVVLITQLTTEKLVFLQGIRDMQSLAKANLYGNLISFFFTIPLYILYGPKSIVIVLILISITQYLLAKAYSKTGKENSFYVSRARVFVVGKKILKDGFAIGLTLSLIHI